MSEKTCIVCGKTKDRDQFYTYISKKGKTAYRKDCIECKRDIMREAYRTNKYKRKPGDKSKNEQNKKEFLEEWNKTGGRNTGLRNSQVLFEVKR